MNEDFAIESLAGDVFILGNHSWRIRYVRGGEVTVTDAQGAPASVPFWLGEAPGRTDELSNRSLAASRGVGRANRCFQWRMELGTSAPRACSTTTTTLFVLAIRLCKRRRSSPQCRLRTTPRSIGLAHQVQRTMALEQAVRYVAAQKSRARLRSDAEAHRLRAVPSTSRAECRSSSTHRSGSCDARLGPRHSQTILPFVRFRLQPRPTTTASFCRRSAA